MLDPARTLARLRGLHDATRTARVDGDLPALADAVARTAADALGYGTVAVNVYRPAWDDLEVVSVEGDDEARAALLGTTVPLAEWEQLLDERFRRGGAYFVPEGEVEWHDGAVPSYVPDTAPHGEDGWRPGDALFVPLRHSDGHLLGVLSVDRPTDGRRPDDHDLELLAAAGSYIAHALESAGEALASERHRHALEQLLAVSSALTAGESTAPVLDAVCDAIRTALSFNHVVIELADPERDRYRPVAASGTEADAATLELDVPIAQLDRAFDAAFEVEGCYLLPRAEAVARGRR